MIRIRLSRLLGERRMTQAELARQTGIRKATINEMYWELCENVKLEMLDEICRVLKCKVCELLEEETEEERQNKER